VVFGFAAVLALVHDVLIAVGFLALSYWMSNDLGMTAILIDPFKISLAVVAALLTIVGFSINDTIVIFDRIREIRGKSPELTGDMINRAINETLSRTFITSGTLLIATFILYLFGGMGIHPFAFTMLVGVISGTYSTVFIAAPILVRFFPNTSPTATAATAQGKTRVATKS
jgi:SecD/SecF fusion protein